MKTDLALSLHVIPISKVQNLNPIHNPNPNASLLLHQEKVPPEAKVGFSSGTFIVN